ncbi:Cytochrome B5 isoform D (AtCb5-D) (Cytochrome b5 isoform B) (AtCb5-B) [Durusdinium trenchii]|uniref:Cytochrome B5 isoform D (AtCb5-D) (Cytochrome b5 isoform B) (AtCb5-B) n=1 Tax=Durusdinium trenchii TaxID=1381693 RepID=A0ABP0M2U8_9DINO
MFSWLRDEWVPWPWSRRMRGRVITRDELWQHRWRICPKGVGQNCWVSIRGLVLQLPAELFARHPGGTEVLRQATGGDATEAFGSHSAYARAWADRYVIGFCPEIYNQACVARF